MHGPRVSEISRTRLANLGGIQEQQSWRERKPLHFPEGSNQTAALTSQHGREERSLQHRPLQLPQCL